MSEQTTYCDNPNPMRNIYPPENSTSPVEDAEPTESYATNQPREILRLREIRIKPLNHGYLVTVGCQQFAISDFNKLMLNIQQYLLMPDEIERQWLNKEWKVL